MSYSLYQLCDKCAKQSACADRVIVQQAVNTIHSIPTGFSEGKPINGHLGGGMILHHCSLFEPKMPEPTA